MAAGHQTRIMYIENKGDDGIVGDARIGRVTFSKTGRSLYYRGQRFQSLNGSGFKSNYVNVETGEHYWISGCRRDGADALYSTSIVIDEDVREEYWTSIRNRPELKEAASLPRGGKYPK
jgi:hypothetical protein